MSIRGFKQMFSIVFAVILGGLLLAVGLNLRALIPPANGNAILETAGDLVRQPLYVNTTAAALCIVGLLLGVILGPKAAQKLINVGNSIERMSSRDKIAVGIGTFLGIVCTIPFYLLLLRWPIIGIPILILITVVFVYLGIRAMVSMKDEFRFIGAPIAHLGPDGAEISMDHAKILDTNVIIDGRIRDVCRTGFIEGPLYVPGFVLDELQHIADSSDSLKRARGRRGLDILGEMQKEFPLVVRTQDHLLDGERGLIEVDARLVKLASKLTGTIVTNDFNLNKVAALQGVTVLNVNELANALKPVVLPGEEMMVAVIKEGKESNQGVAYLDDGTMIVVEDGRRHIGENLDVVVTSVLQTVAGKMIFAKLKGANGDEDASDYGRARPGGGARTKIR